MEINFGLNHYKALLNWYELLFASKKREPTEDDVDTLALIVQMFRQECRNVDARKLGSTNED